MTAMETLLRSFIHFAGKQAVLQDCFLVGGAVRDMFLGRELSDYDLLLRRDARKYAEAFAAETGGRCIVLDELYGTMRVTHGGHYLDICLMQGAALEDDLANRDFTLNAMALPLGALHAPDRNEQIIDPCGGRDDLAQKRVRMVSADNLTKDPLRMLRAYRFAQELGFIIEGKTIETIRQHGPIIAHVAVERITDELRHVLLAATSYQTIRLMDRDRLLEQIFPDLITVGKIPRQKLLQSFGYLEHILNNPHLYFPGHAEAFSAYFRKPSRRMAMKLAVLFPSLASAEENAKRLRCSRAEIDYIAGMRRYADRFSDAMGAEKEERLKLVHTIGPGLYAQILYHICQECICQLADSLTVYYCREMLDLYHGEYQERAALLPLLTGDELMKALSLSPSPRVGKILTELEQMTLDGRISTKREALAAAQIVNAHF